MSCDRSSRTNGPALALDGMRVVVFVAEGVEDLEYWVTVMRLREAGALVTSVGTATEPIAGKHGLEARADRLAQEIDSAEVDGLVIPGGWAPDKLRRQLVDGQLHFVQQHIARVQCFRSGVGRRQQLF